VARGMILRIVGGFWACVVLVLLAACGGLSKLPDEGGPGWLELHSQNFVLQTDLAEPEAVAVLERAERLFTGLLHAGWPSGGVMHLRLRLVVFAEREDFEHFGGDDIAGYHVANALFEPMVVMPAPTRLEGVETLAHELTHYIAYQSMQRHPAWLAEGMAVYYESARYDSEGNFVIGRVPRGRWRSLRFVGLMPTATLMSEDTDPFASWNFYPTAWLLTHYLMSKQRQAFDHYLRALGQGEPHAQAWRGAFGDLDHTTLDHLIHQYAQDGAYDNFGLKVPAAAKVSSRRALDSADVSALRALLHVSCPSEEQRSRAAVQAHLEAALGRDPQHLYARAVRAVYTKSVAESKEQARELARANSRSWLAWLLLATSYDVEDNGAKGQDAALERAVAVAPHQPYALMLLAQRKAKNGERELALQRSEQALRLQSNNAELMLLRAGVLAELGDCARLKTVTQALTARPPSHGGLNKVGRLQLLEHAARCRDVAAALPIAEPRPAPVAAPVAAPIAAPDGGPDP